LRLRPHPEVRVDPGDAALDEARDERGVAELPVLDLAERAGGMFATVCGERISARKR
jgi:hypothetical protein